MLQREDFARGADQEFDLHVGGATMTLTLVAIEPFRTKADAPREAFSLIFKSASHVVLPQGTYSMRNRSLVDAAVVGIFIVPIGRDADGIRYQAVFN